LHTRSDMHYKPSAWIAATHSLQAKRASGLVLTQTVWRKRTEESN